MAFTKAKRTKVPIKIAITGPTGSGKTYSALLMASGMSDKIALIDTENESASLYDEVVDFDVLNIHAPFTVQKYTNAIKEAEKAGYEVLIIDSLTHVWSASGGLLQQKEVADASGGNQYANWGPITKQYETLKSTILESKMHIICCMRSKMAYDMDGKNEKTGRTEVKKIGLAPVMREGIEYEFTVLLDVSIDHYATATKDRTHVFEGMVESISAKHGKLLMDWQQNAAPLPQEAEPEAKLPKMATDTQVSRMRSVCKKLNLKWQWQEDDEITYAEYFDFMTQYKDAYDKAAEQKEG